ncbi:hypothetical protein Tcan_04543 [Toxocara canis]|uniref:Uncharacterized protein n=1 Tax=Toxocara canis TaxID=6265 RepID=A0A0B2VEM5_TOXCA|nr:hypothetical protein Tcan_04543 [Toxocara canis]
MAVFFVKTCECESSTRAENNRLGLSCRQIYLSENMSREVRLSWNFADAVNLIDWIGLFEVDFSRGTKFLRPKINSDGNPNDGMWLHDITRDPDLMRVKGDVIFGVQV